MSMEPARAWLAQRGFEERIRTFEVSSATVELAAQALGCEGARIAKTLSFAVGEGCVLVVCAGDYCQDHLPLRRGKRHGHPGGGGCEN